MSQALATIAAGQVMVPSLLGASSQRIPTGGKIRPGIKVLTKKAQEHPKAREIYERGVEAEHAFERIESDITAAIPELKTPLVPKNAPYFTVRRGDFPNPELSKQIIEAFGEDRGDGVKRLYRFPVIFPADAWQSVMPHELASWGAHERKFWSEYSPDGQTRYCKHYAPVPVNAAGKRALRLFGGRKIMLRQENAGVCEPERCKEYQERKCSLSGRFIFFIPGIKSINAFELHTTSFYAMNAAIQKFQMIAFMRGGRISGFLDGNRTPFYLAKKLMEVPHIDDEGRAVRVKQWIIDLEAPIDVTALLQPDEGIEAIEYRACEAVTVLEGVPAGRVVSRAGEIEPFKCLSPGVTDTTDVQGASTLAVSAGMSKRAATRTSSANGATASEGAEEVAAVVRDAQALGVSSEQFEQYAEKRWGKGWAFNPNGRRRVHDEVRGFKGNAGGFRSKVQAELDVGS